MPSFHDSKGKACSDVSWRYDTDGRIEVPGQGKPEGGWPKDVNQWSSLIHESASRHGVPPQFVASIMAIESVGKPGLCLRRADGSCNLAEGVGLMAILVSTAEEVLGRHVDPETLRTDNALNIDIGTKLLRGLLDKYGGDFVHAAVAYNAGSVRCGLPRTFCPKKPCLDQETCPDFWGVVQGCVRRNSPSSGMSCAPSQLKPGMFNCTVRYPLNAIRMHNAAVTNFLGVPWSPPSHEQPPSEHPTKRPAWPWAVAGLGMATGLAVAVLAVPRVARSAR